MKRTAFIVRIGNLPVRFGDRIDTVASDELASRFDSHAEALHELRCRGVGFGGVTIISIQVEGVPQIPQISTDLMRGETTRFIWDYSKRKGV
jgi:hypothetical protein